MQATEKLTNVQLELLKLFKYQLPDKQLVEIKNILAKYFANSATEEMEKFWNENNWNEQTVNNLANQHLRKK